MRREILLRSVQRLLPDGDRVEVAVFMWRAPWMLVGLLVTVSVVIAGLTLADVAAPATRVVIALALATIVAVATTDNRVLVASGAGVRWMRAGRVRQVAVDDLGPVPRGTSIEVVSSNLVLTDWAIGDDVFTVYRRSQAAMSDIAARLDP